MECCAWPMTCSLMNRTFFDLVAGRGVHELIPPQDDDDDEKDDDDRRKMD